jgi:hypothetical protein
MKPEYWVLVFVSVVFIAIGGFFAFLAFQDFWDGYQLGQSGVQAKAEVLSSDFTTSKGVNTYNLTYRLSVADSAGVKRDYQRSQNIDQTSYFNYYVGYALDVTYLPNNPAVSRITGYIESGQTRIVGIVCGITGLALGFFFLFWILRKIKS